MITIAEFALTPSPIKQGRNFLSKDVMLAYLLRPPDACFGDLFSDKRFQNITFLHRIPPSFAVVCVHASICFRFASFWFAIV